MRPLVLFIAALISLEALAAESEAHFTLLTELSADAPKRTLVNPDNVLDVGAVGGELAGILEGRVVGVRWRARVAERLVYVRSAREEDHELLLNELVYAHRFGEAWSVSVGKQLLNWSTGLAYQPLGFFRASGTDLTDIFDVEGRSEGLPILTTTYLGSIVTVDAAVSVNNPGTRGAAVANERQMALRLSGEPLPGMNASVLTRKRQAAWAGVGVGASYALESLELHGDLYVGPEEAGAGTVWGALPESSHRYVPQSVVGLTWTPLESLSLYAEWIHLGSGVSSQRWRGYLGQVDAHRRALDVTDGPPALPSLAADAGALSSDHGVRRDYLFVRADLGALPTSFYVSGYLGLNDGGAILSAAKGWTLPGEVLAHLQASAFVGPARSEFGMVPQSLSMSGRLLRHFD